MTDEGVMTDETDNVVEGLIVSHFDGSLSNDQEETLAKALATSAAARKLFLSYMRMEGRLHSLGSDGFLREPQTAQDTDSDSSETRPAIAPSQDRLATMGTRLLAASASLAVCAVVMLTLLSGILVPSSVNASSVLKKAKQVAEEMIDRTYHVTFSNASESSRTRELSIDVRGGGRFLVRPESHAYLMGSDGSDYWITRNDGPVWITSEFRSLRSELRRMIPNRRLVEIAASPNEPLLLGMSDLLWLIEQKYDVELIHSTSDSGHHVRARPKAGKRNSPTQIDFWADFESGVVRKAVILWPDHRKMRFELARSVTRSAQWYQPSTHAPKSEVVRLGPATSR